MSNPEIASLDQANRQILSSIRQKCRQREVYSQRPARNYMEQDRKVADDIAALERQWVDARENADQKFMDLALQKPYIDRVSLYKVRACGLQASARIDAKYSASARMINCPVADDYALLSHAQQKKGELFLALADQAKHEHEEARMAAVRDLSNPHDRDRNMRSLARQYSKRADMQASTPEDQARMQARAEELTADLPEKPVLGASDLTP